MSTTSGSLLGPSIVDKYLSNTLSDSLDSDGRDGEGDGGQQVVLVRRELLKWYLANRRKLPWRGDSATLDGGEDTSPVTYPFPFPYGTWVSEIMLQQTQVATVIPFWLRWMTQFPDVQTLAAATSDDVNKLWSGLGYYRRAQMLRQGAVAVMGEFGGVIPSTAAELMRIPGIGPYTAGAIASIGFNQVEPLVDGNVIRVLSRLRALRHEVGSKAMDTACWSLARSLVDPESPGDFNQGLMELGATICTPTSPKCNECPVASVCRAKFLVEHCKTLRLPDRTAPASSISADADDIETLMGLPLEVTYFPRKAPKKKARDFVLSVGVFITPESKYLLIRRPVGKGLLANQWEFPNVVLYEEELPKKRNRKQSAKTVSDTAKITTTVDEDGGDVGGDGEDSVDEEVAPVAIPSFTQSELWQPFPTYLKDVASIQWLDDGAPVQQGIKVMQPSKSSSHAIQDGSDVSAPIVHVFSHQKHHMHITVRHVTTNHVPIDEPWISCCGQNREIRWMSRQEILECGVTTGCKKILEQVSNPGGPSKANKDKKNAALAASGDNTLSPVGKKPPANAGSKRKAAIDPKQTTVTSFFAAKVISPSEIRCSDFSGDIS
jgi:A/G-specific adenine glycosylase